MGAIVGRRQDASQVTYLMTVGTTGVCERQKLHARPSQAPLVHWEHNIS